MATRPSLWLITLACMLILSRPLDAFASRSDLEAKKMMATTTAATSRIGSSEVRVMEGDEEKSQRFRSTAASASARQVPTGPDPIHHHGGPPLGRRRLLQ